MIEALIHGRDERRPLQLLPRVAGRAWRPHRAAPRPREEARKADRHPRGHPRSQDPPRRAAGGTTRILEEGERVYVTPDPSVKRRRTGEELAPRSSTPGCLEQFGPGQTIYLDDGLVELRVEAVDAAAGRALCRVVTGGELRSRKGVSLARGRRGPSGHRRDRRGAHPLRRRRRASTLSQPRSSAGPSTWRRCREVIRARRRHAAGDRQDRKPRGRAQPGRYPRSGRRDHGGPRRHGRGAAVGRGPSGAKRTDRQVQPAGKTGDYGDADARLHGAEPKAHPGRSDRRGQRHLRRDGRGDAFGRDGGGPLPGRGRADDGPHRPQRAKRPWTTAPR